MVRSTTDSLDVLCVGIAVADVMAKPIDELPAWDHLATFDHIEHHIGGCAVNTGVDLARLGVKAAVSACLGRDGAGQFVRRRLEEEGVDVSGLVETNKASSSYTFVMIGSDGRRRYLHHVGANRARARLPRRPSMDTAFNPNVDCRALLQPCLPYLDIFIPSIEEANAVTGRLGRAQGFRAASGDDVA